VPKIAVEMQRSRNAIRDWAKKLNIAVAKSPHPRQRRMKLETARLQRVEIEAKSKKA